MIKHFLRDRMHNYLVDINKKLLNVKKFKSKKKMLNAKRKIEL